MKHLLLGLIISTAAIPSFAGGVASCLLKENNPYYNGNCDSFIINGKTYRINRTESPRIATRSDLSADDVIREVNGKEQLYSKQSAGTALVGNNLSLYMDDFPTQVVWGDNNMAYFKDILSTCVLETYVKGEVKGDEITFKTGQLVEFIEGDEEYPSYGIGVGLGRVEKTATDYVFTYDPSFTEFSIKLEKDGKMSLQLPGEPFNGVEPSEYMLCYYYTDDLLFAGFSDFYQEYEPEDLVPVEMPKGVEPQQYVYIDTYDYASFVEVAFTDDYLYIKGLNPMMEESVVRAKIEGDKAVIAQNEYQGIYMDLWFIFTKVLVDNPDYDEDDYYSIPYLFAPSDVGFEMSIDRKAGLIYADTEGVYLSFQPDEESLDNIICVLSEFSLKEQTTAAGTPANPSHLVFLDSFVEYQGFYDFQFNISNYSKEGNVLEVETLYYQILVDGEPLVFEPEEILDLNNEWTDAYIGLPEPQIWIPYLFNNGYDISKYSSNEFDVGIYLDGFETLGVRTMYIYDGKVTYSDIVTLNMETGEVNTGVKEITDSREINTEYYTLSGIKTVNPHGGIFIKRSLCSDGKVIAKKILIP